MSQQCLDSFTVYFGESPDAIFIILSFYYSSIKSNYFDNSKANNVIKQKKWNILYDYSMTIILWRVSLFNPRNITEIYNVQIQHIFQNKHMIPFGSYFNSTTKQQLTCILYFKHWNILALATINRVIYCQYLFTSLIQMIYYKWPKCVNAITYFVSLIFDQMWMNKFINLLQGK